MKNSGKGVVCHIAEDEDMPVDANGVRADIVFYGISSIKRMNMGRPHEQSSNAAARDLIHRLRKHLGLDQFEPTEEAVTAVLQDPANVNYVMEKLLGLYKILSPMMEQNLRAKGDWYMHAYANMLNGYYIWSPPNNPINHLDAAVEIWSSEYRPTYGPVTYRDVKGNTITTKAPVLIGDFYMILLEKTTDEWSAAASVRQQHLGLPSKLNNSDKYSTYGRAQAGRGGSGEAENRNQNANVGSDPLAELMELSNNPLAHRAHLETLFNAEHPSNIDHAVNRQQVPRGNSRPNMLLRNLLSCYGIEFTKVASGE